MAVLILLALVLVPVVEIAVFIEVGGRIGAAPTIAITLLTAAAGIFLLRREGFAAIERARASLESGRFPLDEVFSGLCLLAAGGLLLIPGLVTDVLGLVLFVPAVRRVLGREMTRRFAAKAEIRTFDSQGNPVPPGDRAGVTIEGEFREIDPSDAKPPDDEPPPSLPKSGPKSG